MNEYTSYVYLLSCPRHMGPRLYTIVVPMNAFESQDQHEHVRGWSECRHHLTSRFTPKFWSFPYNICVVESTSYVYLLSRPRPMGPRLYTNGEPMTASESQDQHEHITGWSECRSHPTSRFTPKFWSFPYNTCVVEYTSYMYLLSRPRHMGPRL